MDAYSSVAAGYTFPIRINFGKEIGGTDPQDYVDASALNWWKNTDDVIQRFDGTPVVKAGFPSAVSGTPDTELYQMQVHPYPQSFMKFRLDVASGIYSVRCKFAESTSLVTGDRVFNVTDPNGPTAKLSDLDVYGEVGSRQALDKSFGVTVSGSEQFALDFQATSNIPMISAIEVSLVSQPVSVDDLSVPVTITGGENTTQILTGIVVPVTITGGEQIVVPADMVVQVVSVGGEAISEPSDLVVSVSISGGVAGREFTEGPRAIGVGSAGRMITSAAKSRTITTTDSSRSYQI